MSARAGLLTLESDFRVGRKLVFACKRFQEALVDLDQQLGIRRRLGRALEDVRMHAATPHGRMLVCIVAVLLLSRPAFCLVGLPPSPGALSVHPLPSPWAPPNARC
jgi:hypothetical protein